MLSDKRGQAIRLVRLAIHAVAREAFGSPAGKHPIPGSAGTARDVGPLPGLRAAVLARDVATQCVQDYARAVRGEGCSWDAIAEILGLEPTDPLVSRGSRAYLHVVDGRPLHPEDPEEHSGSVPVAHWRCASCGQYVTDYGPFDADPADNERGHAPECARHNTEITTYLAGWGGEE